MNKNYANTYAYHDHKGRRLAVFCRYLDDFETAEIFTIACSQKDQFRKKFAVQEYEKYLNNTIGEGGYLALTCHPEIEQIKVLPEQRELKTLINYCDDNYFYLIEAPLTILVPSLVTPQELDDIINAENN